MTRLNFVGAELAEKNLVSAGTDITGFGLLGHLGSMCRASGVGAEINASAVPVIGGEVLQLIDRECIPGGTRDNLKTAEEFTAFANATAAEKFLLADAQTSGGLLLCVRPRKLETVLGILKKLRAPCASIVGTIVRASKPQIWVKR
jgi:selenide,water dikinase